MKDLYATMPIFLLSGGLALAQGTRSDGIKHDQPPNPSGAPAPTAGLAAGVNPSNSQDLTNRSNPQDLTQPAAEPAGLRR